MDKNILIEYADMREEVKDLRRRIQKDKREIERLEEMVVSDTVTCGKKGRKPLKTVKVTGKPEGAIERKKRAHKKNMEMLMEKEAELMELMTQVEEYIETLPESRMRMMFRLHYIDNLIWEKVAVQMNYAYPKKNIPYTGDSCRIAHDRILKKLS